MKIPVNGKIPLDEKPGGNLVMCERNFLRLNNPCFIKECFFFCTKSTVCVVLQLDKTSGIGSAANFQNKIFKNLSKK